MRNLYRLVIIFFLFLGINVSAFSNVKAVDKSDSAMIAAMQSTGHILMIRHAIAPGFGDPDNIQIGDCTTQRNLDESGRKQSKQIGAWLKSHNITPSAIYSSQWCRCLDTARLLDLGEVKELPALNSFFQMTENREPNLKNLNEFMSKLDTENKLIIMVTHSVTISAISGETVASGNGVLLKINNTKPFEFMSVVKPVLFNKQ